MSDKKLLGDRRQALEDIFFKEVEAKQIARLQAELAARKECADLKEVAGIEDEALLKTLVGLDVHAADVTSLTLVPLVRVAWADGTINDKERDAVLKAAHAQGILEGTHGHVLLDRWLEKEPTSTLYEAWAGYIDALLSHVSSEEQDALKDSVLGLAHDVASAAGGILGIGAISANEESALKAIGSAFNR